MLSVVTPTCNSEEPLARLLASLVPGAADGVVREVIVADRGSTDGTRAVAEAAGCLVLEAKGPTGVQLAAGAAAASRGAWLMFVAPGIVLPPGWFAEVTAFVESAAGDGAAEGRAAAFGLPTDRRARRVGAAAGRLRRAVTGMPDPDQGLVIARAFYAALGGHDPGHPRPAADLYRRIGRRRLAVLRTEALRIGDPS